MRLLAFPSLIASLSLCGCVGAVPLLFAIEFLGACAFDDTLREYLDSHFWLPFSKFPPDFAKRNVRLRNGLKKASFRMRCPPGAIRVNPVAPVYASFPR
jgi:hypothetical protein